MSRRQDDQDLSGECCNSECNSTVTVNNLGDFVKSVCIFCMKRFCDSHKSPGKSKYVCCTCANGGGTYYTFVCKECTHKNDFKYNLHIPFTN